MFTLMYKVSRCTLLCTKQLSVGVAVLLLYEYIVTTKYEADMTASGVKCAMVLRGLPGGSAGRYKDRSQSSRTLLVGGRNDGQLCVFNWDSGKIDFIVEVGLFVLYCCVCVCIYAYLGVCVCVCVYMPVFVSVCVFLCESLFVCLRLCLCLSVCVFVLCVSFCASVFVYLCVSVFVCLSVCVSVFVYLCRWLCVNISYVDECFCLLLSTRL